MSLDTASGPAATDEGSGYSEEEAEAAEPLPASGYRTYEVYQRERTGETTNLLKPRQLISRDFADDPYPLLEILRENYPCYRDWVGNRFWITRYDDVTSLIADEANFETRSKRWFYGRPDLGRDLNGHLPVAWARANAIDAHVEPVTAAIIDRLGNGGDVAIEFAASLPLELWGRALDLPQGDLPAFSARYWRVQRGWLWDPVSQKDGLAAVDELIAYVEPLLAARRADPGDDMISAMAGLELPDGPVTAADVVVTILEPDHETLHGALANLWFRLLTDPEQFAAVRDEPRMMKFAYLETLRHSTPVLSAMRFAAPRGRTLRPPVAGRGPRVLLGRCGQPRPAGVRRPRHVHRRAQGPVSARAPRPVPCRWPPGGRRAGLRQTDDPSGRAQGTPTVDVRHHPRHRHHRIADAARRVPVHCARRRCRAPPALAAYRRDAHLLVAAGARSRDGSTPGPDTGEIPVTAPDAGRAPALDQPTRLRVVCGSQALTPGDTGDRVIGAEAFLRAQLAMRFDHVALDGDVFAPDRSVEWCRLLIHTCAAHLLPGAIFVVSGSRRSVAATADSGAEGRMPLIAELAASSGLDAVADGAERRWERTRRRTVHDLVADARAGLDRLEPAALVALLASDPTVVVLDSRTPTDREADGVIAGSIHAPRTVLEWMVDPASGYAHDIGAASRLVVVCNEGYSSSLAARTLQELGFDSATDLIGGVQAWRSAGLATVAPTGHHHGRCLLPED